MHDVERHDDVARRENDNVAAREPLAAKPLPVDEAGLEPGRDTRPGQVPAHGTTPEHDMVRDAGAVRDDDVDDSVREHETTPGRDTELFTDDAVVRFRDRWRELQADFVDDPERAVRAADGVVDEVVRTITEHRQRLAGEWRGHTDTEHLRLAMREYRSFVDRLLPTT